MYKMNRNEYIYIYDKKKGYIYFFYGITFSVK